MNVSFIYGWLCGVLAGAIVCAFFVGAIVLVGIGKGKGKL
jgi:hypothetical protein